MFHWISSRRFVFQLILIFVIFTLATVIGLGIPVSILLNRQVESQMRALLDQASQTTVALYENKTNQLNYLAALIVERPTLNRLVFEREDSHALDQYLDEFLRNAVVDIIVVCDQNTPIAMAGESAVPELCSPPSYSAFSSVNDDAWLLVDILLTGGTVDYHIVVGQRAASIFTEFERQSGLEYVLFEGRQLSASSEFDLDSYFQANGSSEVEHYQLLTLNADIPRRNTHMAGVIPLPSQEGFTLVGLLDISTYQALSRDVQRIILGTLLIVGLAGVIVAILVSRQISQPLNRLARSAAALRQGDLSTSLPAETKVWEIDQLTNALEDARVSLKHSLEQLRLEKAWIENLLNAVVEGFLAIDENHQITFASEAVERILEIKLSMIMGHQLDDVFVTPEGEDLFSHQLPGANQSRRIPVAVRGKDILLSVSASKIIPPDAGDATQALVIRDVTDEQRIHRLIGEFLANITHEFRTPLSALSASVELLLDQLPSLSSPEIEQLLHAINIGIVDLQSLIDNLIEAASIEAGRFKVNPHPVPPHLIIEDAIRTVVPIAQRQGLELINTPSDIGLMVLADRRRTCQALVNMLSNAIKYSPEGGAVTVISKLINGSVQIEVHDEGKGVPSDQRSNVFNRFISPSKQGDYDQLGLGLGLSVVKAIIDAQDGSVGFRDGESGGAVFWLTLPLLREDEA